MGKTVEITGSSRGFGFAMLELFAKAGCDVVICARNEEGIVRAAEELKAKHYPGRVLSEQCDVTDPARLEAMIGDILKQTGKIDIWINNAGVNQPDQWIWDIDPDTVSKLLDINLKGDIYCSQAIMKVFREQKSGQIYFVEGFGYDGHARPRLSLYGTSKRGVNFLIDSLAADIREAGLNVQVGAIIPGIMITDFLHKSLGDGDEIKIPEQTKKVYNVLGDYPETIAAFMVPKILANKKAVAKFAWLTNARAAARFMTSGFRKRDFFKE